MGCTQRKLRVGAVALLRISRCASWGSLGSLVWLGSANQDTSSIPPVKLISVEWVEPSWSLALCLIHSLPMCLVLPKECPRTEGSLCEEKDEILKLHKGMSNLCLSSFSMTCTLGSEWSSTARRQWCHVLVQWLKNPLLNYYYYLFPGLSNGGFFSFLESSLWAAYLRLHTENILGVCVLW